VGWWEGGDTGCFKCLDPSKRKPYTAKHDLWWPPHVLVKKPASIATRCGKADGFDDHTSMYCGVSNRGPNLGRAASAEACFKLCPQCDAVGWWEGGDTGCFKCIDPSKRKPYTNKKDAWWPPHVLVNKLACTK